MPAHFPSTSSLSSAINGPSSSEKYAKYSDLILNINRVIPFLLSKIDLRALRSLKKRHLIYSCREN